MGMQSLTQRQLNKLERYLVKLDPEARFIAIIGRGFESQNSTYKVFVHSREGAWWCFDSIAGPIKLKTEQILATYKTLKIVRGKLSKLARLQHTEDKHALHRLFEVAAAYASPERVRRTRPTL